MTKTYDPSKLSISSRLFRDEDENGVIVDENTKEWKSGEVEINVSDKDGIFLGSKRIKMTRTKYLAFREDFDGLSTEEVVSEYFPKLKTGEASKTELQEAAEDAAEQTSDREATIKAEEKEADEVRFTSAEPIEVEYKEADNDGNITTRTEEEKVNSDFQNVRPVGDPDETPSNPEQKIFAPEALKIAQDGKEVVNPEQSAPNVPEDKFNTKGGNDTTPSVTTEVERNVTPVGADATTNKEVAEVKENTPDAKATKKTK